MGNQGLSRFNYDKDYPMHSRAYRTKGRIICFGAPKVQPTWGRFDKRALGCMRTAERVAQTHGGLVG